MFQYAFVKSLSLRNQHEFLFDISEYQTYFRPFELEIFSIDKQYAEEKDLPWYMWLRSTNRYLNYIFVKIQSVCKLLNSRHHREINLKFSQDLLNISNWYVEWYFQSEQYFIDFADEIRKDFTFVHEPSLQNQQIIHIISSSQSVSVHIRRGDYLKGNNLQYHGICSLEYYRTAIEIIRNKVSDARFFFFSDDIEWVRKNIQTWNNDDVYVDHNTWDQSREDMRLMSLCRHNIVANSSFSRRWAWLNNNPEKIVIAPLKRFENKELDYTNIAPENRIRI